MTGHETCCTSRSFTRWARAPSVSVMTGFFDALAGATTAAGAAKQALHDTAMTLHKAAFSMTLPGFWALSGSRQAATLRT